MYLGEFPYQIGEGRKGGRIPDFVIGTVDPVLSPIFTQVSLSLLST